MRLLQKWSMSSSPDRGQDVLHSDTGEGMGISADALLAEGRAALAKAQIESAFLDARILLQHLLATSAEGLLRDGSKQLSATIASSYRAVIARRVAHEPIAKIIGSKAFWKHDFITTTATLDPRPETETLVEAALAFAETRTDARLRLLDLGTGTGCVLLSLLAELPQSRGVGVDASAAALAIAAQNAERLPVTDRLTLMHSDWFSAVAGTFDVILSNPPYIPLADRSSLAADVAAYDPASALFAGEDGLEAYRAIFAGAAPYLSSHGRLMVEIGAGQQARVSDIAAVHQFYLREVWNDLAGIPRVLVFELDLSSKESLL